MSLNQELKDYAQSFMCIQISTLHVKPEDLEALGAIVSRGSSNLVTECYSDVYVRVPVDFTDRNDVAALRTYGELSDEFYALVAEVQKYRYGLIIFSDEAMMYSTFPTYPRS